MFFYKCMSLVGDLFGVGKMMTELCFFSPGHVYRWGFIRGGEDDD